MEIKLMKILMRGRTTRKGRSRSSLIVLVTHNSNNSGQENVYISTGNDKGKK